MPAIIWGGSCWSGICCTAGGARAGAGATGDCEAAEPGGTPAVPTERGFLPLGTLVAMPPKVVPAGTLTPEERPIMPPSNPSTPDTSLASRTRASTWLLAAFWKASLSTGPDGPAGVPLLPPGGRCLGLQLAQLFPLRRLQLADQGGLQGCVVPDHTLVGEQACT